MKLFVCDVEGTIFTASTQIDGTDYLSTMWQPIAERLGEAAIDEERKTHEKWDNKDYINYLDWVKESISIHKRYGLKQSVFKELIELAEYNDGVEELFANLDRDTWIPVLVSGGFQNLIRRAQDELNIEFGFGACEYYFNQNDGYLEHYSIQPSDFGGKVKYVKMLIAEMKLNFKTDWVYIGDGKNDIGIAKKAPLAFGINAHRELKNVNNLIEIKTFMDILPHIDRFAQKKSRYDKSIPDEKKNRIPKPSDSENVLLKRQIIDLKRKNTELKNELNKERQKKSRKKGERLKIKESDYKNTSPKSLSKLLEGLKVVFLGMRQEYAAFNRLQKFFDLRVIPIDDDKFNTQTIKDADILFIYKNCMSHSFHKRIFKASLSPYCLLREHSNEQLLENAIANVLYRFFYSTR